MNPVLILLVLFLGGNLAAAPLTFSTWAGASGTPGNIDGSRLSARFNGPGHLTLDGSGNIYIADRQNSAIRKISPDGVVSTLAGDFSFPNGVAVDSTGNIYVADTSNCAIRKITPAGQLSVFAGALRSSGTSDGLGGAARFTAPYDLTVDLVGNVYVADPGVNTIRKITPDGLVGTLAGLAYTTGSVDATGSAARFNRPSGLAVDATGTVYVADFGSNTIRKITSSGVVTTLAGLAGASGSTDGTGAAARFNGPMGVTVDAGGNLYVAESTGQTIRKITSAGVVTTLGGTDGVTGSTNGTGAVALFNSPQGVVLDASGALYVSDTGNSSIRKGVAVGSVYTLPYTFTTIAGKAGISGSTDGTAGAARFWDPEGLAQDVRGNLYVSEQANSIIRRISISGEVTKLAGSVGVRGSNDGTGSAAQFSAAFGLTINPEGTLYVADSVKSTIRKVTQKGVVTTLAGTPGVRAYIDGTGKAAAFTDPMSVACDSAGNLYVVEYNYHGVRKISPTGVVSTVAGASAAGFGTTWGVAVDSRGYIYVGSNGAVRKITPAGVVSTLAGLPGTTGDVDGKGSSARFSNVLHLAVDGAGNVFVSDNGNDLIRKITPAGLVSTIGGLTRAGGSNDGKGAIARFDRPAGIVVDEEGTVYIADSGNQTIRMGTPPVTPEITSTSKLAGTVLKPLSYQILADNAPNTYSVLGTLPAGLKFSKSTGLLNGTPTAAGTFNATLRATNEAGTGSLPLAITIAKSAQKITFLSPGNLPYGTAYSLGATASSGLSVRYRVVSGPATLSGQKLSFSGVGPVTIAATQPGSSLYLPAPEVTRTFSVVKATQSITFPAVGAAMVGQTVTLKATASSGLPVTYTAVAATATISGNKVTFVKLGNIKITASQAGDVYTNAAKPVTVNVPVK